VEGLQGDDQAHLRARELHRETKFLHAVGTHDTAAAVVLKLFSSRRDEPWGCGEICLWKTVDEVFPPRPMPTLPSGRNVAINFQQLNLIAHQAFCAEDEATLLRLDHPAEMFRVIEVADVEFRRDIPCAELDRFWSEEGDKFGVLHPLGYSISDVIRYRTGWSEVDTTAFKMFLMRHSTRQVFRMWRRDLGRMRRAIQPQICREMPLPAAQLELGFDAGPSWHA